MERSLLSPGARAALGADLCQLYLQPIGEISGGLWSWRVYVDGNLHARGPGSTRKDPMPWYASLPTGPHRVVLRKGHGPATFESNTVEFVVDGQPWVLIEVQASSTGVALCMSSKQA